ncbi:sugar phosphate nucleotidyltransferase [Alkalicella caledoniensis]|nr:NDP-sugar synthase [Alkalicella caledoniensis]
MILAAGLGTRLRPLTDEVSKPMVQLGGRPCIEHTVRLLRKHGIKEIMINLYYKPELIMNHFGDGEHFGIKIHYSVEKELMGTAGGLKKVQQFFGDDPILIISGDALTDLNLTDFYDFHKKKGGLASLALKNVQDPREFGVVQISQDDRITQFQEKPKDVTPISTKANTGIYIFEPDIFSFIPSNTFYDFGKQVFPDLLMKGQSMFGYETQAYWCDIGNIDVYKDVQFDILAGIVKVDIPGKKFENCIWLGRNIDIDPDTKIIGPVFIGEKSVIEKGAKIYGPTVIGNNSFVGSNSVIKRSILLEGARVGNDALIADSILGNDQHVQARMICENRTIVNSSKKL